MSGPLAALRSLAARWREESELLRRRGLDREAAMGESYAADLEEELRRWELETLTLKEAAAESPLKYDTLQRKVAEGEIPNAGRKHRPRVRRVDLHPWLDSDGDEGPVAELARARLRSGRES